ncbi:MAG: tRNA (adenosine(37)-N6)-threonylcarbamoyltransferase complex dimerization subunit type 1 TsaB [Ignavibacteria bacterium]|nr:tRNA (adenosine(37)-N6)-threonylcarbamoyltransferase complex dimerization subunit type 1 TsaB [Ignavibacteria bacterium]
MKILAVETSGSTCGVTISNGDLCSTIEIYEPHQQDAQLADCAIECLKHAKLSISEIDAIAISAGPGSFTGLRIGASFAKGLCYGLDLETAIPLVPISTLQSLADQAVVDEFSNHRIVATIPSHRNLTYIQYFDALGKPLTEVALVEVEKLANGVMYGDRVVGPGTQELVSCLHAIGRIIEVHTEHSWTVLSSRFVANTANKQHRAGTLVLMNAKDFVPDYKQEFEVVQKNIVES